MELRKFKHVKNNKTVYAVIGAKDIKEAMDYVYRYKKAEYLDFNINHKATTGYIYKNNLYVGKSNISIKKQISCIIVYRKTIDIMSYA